MLRVYAMVLYVTVPFFTAPPRTLALALHCAGVPVVQIRDLGTEILDPKPYAHCHVK